MPISLTAAAGAAPGPPEQRIPTDTTKTLAPRQAVTLEFDLAGATTITGWTLEFVVSEHRGGARLVEAEGEVLTATTFRVVLSTADMDLEPGDYFWDCWRLDAGQEAPIAFGSFHVRDGAGGPASS